MDHNGNLGQNRNSTALDDERRRFSKHSRQFTDTESNITLIVPENKVAKCPDEYEQSLQVFKEEPAAVNTKPQVSLGSSEDMKSFVSEIESKKKRGSSQNLRSKLSSSMSFSNLSLKTNDVESGDRKIKKSLSIQSLSKFLRPNSEEDNEEPKGGNKKGKRKRDTSKRQSLMAWIFKSK